MLNRANEIMHTGTLRTPIENYSSVPTLAERVRKDAVDLIVLSGVLVAATIVLSPIMVEKAGMRALDIGKKFLAEKKRR